MQVLDEQEIKDKDEFAEYWQELKEKLPVKAQKKLGDALFAPTPQRELLGKIPLINLIVDSLDRDPPPFEGVIAALNAMGLLSALCLTVAMSFPGSVSYDELVAVEQRLSATPQHEYWPHSTDLVENFQQTSIAASVLLASCVIVVVVILIMTATTGCQFYKGHYNAYAAWYQWVRW